MSTAKAFDWQQTPLPPVRQDGPVELESVDCLSCGAGDHETVIVAADQQSSRGTRFRLVRCRHCGLHFTNPRPTAASMAASYADDSPAAGILSDQRPSPAKRGAECASAPARGNLRRRIERHLEQAVLQARYGYPPSPPASLWEHWQAKAGHLWLRHGRQRLHWIPFKPPGRLLDIGCRSEQFLESMQHLGWTVEGINPSAVMARIFRERTGITVHAGGLPHPHIRPDSFDAVTMWDVLERAHRPREVLRQVRTLLKPGGMLVISTHNVASWPSRRFQQEWDLLNLPRHLVHFSPDTLRDLLRREGFGVTSVKHVARPSVLQESARRARKAGWGPLWLRLLSGKRIAKAIAHWTEQTKQADFIRVVAEKV